MDSPDKSSFLGIATWQKPFVKEFSKLAAPLYNLLTAKNINRGLIKTTWGEQEQLSFETLKTNLLNNNTLAHPDFSKEFFMCSDASNLAIGALLFQKDLNKKRIIGYFSRKLSKTETIKGIPEKEMLGLVGGLKYFRPYIYGGKITCFVDQASLKYLIKKEHPNKFSKYRLVLEDFTVRDIKGKENKAAEFLSRHSEQNTNLIAGIATLQNKKQESSRNILQHRTEGENNIYICQLLD